MVGLGSAVMLMVAIPLLWKRSDLDPLDALYRKLCDLLAARGLRRAPHEGPRSFAARVAAAGNALVPAKQQAAAEFLRLYEAARYAGTTEQVSKPTRLELLRQLKSLLNRIR